MSSELELVIECQGEEYLEAQSKKVTKLPSKYTSHKSLLSAIQIHSPDTPRRATKQFCPYHKGEF